MNGSPTHADCAALFKYILHYLQKSLQTVHIRVYNDSASGMLLHRREFVVEIISTDISGENYEKGHPSFLRRKHRPLRMR